MLFLVLTVALSQVFVAAADDSLGTEELFEFLNMATALKTEETVITRADAARLYCLTLGAEPFGSAEFTDISDSNLKGYAATAYQMGWIAAKSSQEFEPGAEINSYDFAKGFVKGLGYSVQAKYSSYDFYIVKLGLLSGVSDDVKAPLTAKNAAVIIDNALNAPLMIQTKFGNDAQFTASDDRTLLTEVHSLKVIKGYVTADEKTAVYSSKGAGEGRIKIGNKLYKTDVSREKILGQFVKAYIFTTRDDEIIKAIFVNGANSKTTDITCSEKTAVYTDGANVLKCETDGRTYKYNVSINASYIYNGSFDANYRLNDINRLRLGEIRLVDNNNDGQTDIIFVDEYTNYVVKSVSGTKIFDKNGQTPIDIDGENTEFVSVTKNGETVELSELKEWNIASVYKSRDNRIIKIIVSDSSAFDEFDSKKTVNGYELFRMQGEYKVLAICGAPSYMLKVGDWGKVYYDFCGRIAAVDIKSDTETYGFLIGANIKGFELEPKFKIVTVLGKSKVFEGLSKIKVNGTTTSGAQLVNTLAGGGPQLITYKTNSDDKIYDIKTVASGGIELSAAGVSGLWRTTSMALGSKYITDGDTVIFGVPADLSGIDEDDIAIVPASSLVNTYVYNNVDIYDLDDMKVAGAFVMRGFDGGSENESIFFVREVERTVSKLGVEADVLYCTQGGNESVLYTDSEMKGKILPGMGIKVSQKANGNVSSAIIEFEGTEANFTDTFVAGERNHGVSAACVKLMGVIEKISENKFLISGSEYIYVNAPRVACYEYNNGREYFREMSFYELKSGDRVFIVKSRDLVTNIIKMPN